MKNRNLNTSTKTKKIWKTLITDDSSILINHILFTPKLSHRKNEVKLPNMITKISILKVVFLFLNYFAFLRSLVGDYKPFYKRSIEDLSEKEKKFDMMRFGK